MRAHHFHIHFRKRRRYAQLFEAFVQHERRKTGGKGNFSRAGQPRRDGSHIGLGDPALKKAFRKFFLESR